MLYNPFIEKLTGLQDVIIKNVTQITVEMPQKEHCCPGAAKNAEGSSFFYGSTAALTRSQKLKITK